MRPNYTIVQALRGAAALWVVLFHVSQGHHIPALMAALPAWLDSALFTDGHLGVAIFFALSGFVIAHSLERMRLDARVFGRFVLRRSIRLDPPYWAAIAVVIVLGFLSAKVKHESYVPPPLAQVAAHLVYLQELLGFRNLDYVFWTLAFEIQFYLLFAGSLTFASRWAGIALTALAFASALHLFDDLHPGLSLPLWGSFFVGALAKWSVRRSAWLPAFLALATVLLFTSDFGAVSAVTAALLWLTVRSGRAESALDWRWLQFLGLISYSLYLIHNPLIGAVAFVARAVAGSGIAADVAVLVITVATAIVGATLFWWLIERPSHALSRRVRLGAGVEPSPADAGAAPRAQALADRQ